MTRITQSMSLRQTLYDINGAYDRLSRTQSQLSSGYRFARPEDDPLAAGRATQLKGELGTIQQYLKNVDEAGSWLATTETALNNTVSMLQRVRELTVQASNGALGQSSLDGIAAEIKQIEDAIRGEMNTSYAGRYVFAGSATLTAPYPPGPPFTYAGNDDSLVRELAPGQQMPVNLRGWEAFSNPPTNGGQNILTSLETLRQDLLAGNRGAIGAADLTAIDAHLSNIGDARATVGARVNRSETQKSRLQDLELNVQDLLSKTQDVDMAKAMTDYSMQQTTYETALRTGARLIQPSLMDFLG